MRPRWFVFLTWLVLIPFASAQVVINEIMYHPPADRDDLQWVELHNPGAQTVNLAGWAFTKGLKFTFSNETQLNPGAFLVVSRDRGAFRTRYGTNLPVLGDFDGRLSHGGETLELSDRTGRPVDTVKFDDQEPWPVSPDGMSPSLERIVPGAPGDAAANWAPSRLPANQRAAGSPGKANASALTNLPPTFSNVRFDAPTSGRAIPVTATASDADGVREVHLAFQVVPVSDLSSPPTPKEPAWQDLRMSRTEGDERGGRYSAVIPPQPEGRLVRFRLNAIDATGASRLQPHSDDARPTWSIYVGTNVNTAQIDRVSILEFGPPEAPGASVADAFGPGPRRGRRASLESGVPARGKAVLLVMPARGGEIQVFDHIRVSPRKGGWKVRLHKDRMFEGMSTINVLFEHHPRYVLAEHLAFELYRSCGVAAPLSGHWRVWHNGRPIGYHLYVEQVNGSFLRRNSRDDEGDLFKLLWYGPDLIGQHEKKNNPHTGHNELVAVVEALRKSRDASQWGLIQQHFEVEAFVNYYAVNMCLQNWDGFFNNYYVYRAPGPTGKWEIFPWDEDKTWGEFDGSTSKYDWVEMPLTIGMNGDQPRTTFTSRFSGGPYGGAPWWRPPGWFSGPLLANPEFRAKFRTRLQQICETVFTSVQMEVAIARLERRLEPEIRFRASVVSTGADTPFTAISTQAEAEASAPEVKEPLASFRRHIDSFRRQVEKRREFILRELAKER